MSELLDKCKAYGADVTGAMERFMDDEELYEMCLEQFADDPGFAGLEKAVGEKQYKEAFEHAHALKGVAGNLGLTPLFEAVCELVEPLRAEDYSNIDAEYARIEEERERLNKLIGR
ncbi:Hpt domain-containing protein [Hespellia stercorisuis]|uniref:HPt (Histidine-containing phosphotransfer) domain-containing protein n=1 Tax=Hespellia stercorisuis DSM 15480 TaxID=1121950 RepID=A0A1M6P6U1_9FIRM|nr:Hpt domain-containing protein [Hespellia stercorisuis]SHK03622.1 HPt (histidine-containing phosphotransfer) domain-containing protein [Hespellia stercorisuis DSM 15480]